MAKRAFFYIHDECVEQLTFIVLNEIVTEMFYYFSSTSLTVAAVLLSYILKIFDKFE